MKPTWTGLGTPTGAFYELPLDEQTKLIERVHAEAGHGALHPASQDVARHCRLHAIIEGQLQTHEAVREAADKLLSDGLTHHATLHAIIEVFVRHMHAKLTQGEDDEGYGQRLAGLDAADFIASRIH